MERREFINTAAVATLALGAGNSLASGKGHKHHKMNSKYSKVVQAASHCVQTGEECAAHCIELLGSGDKSMKDCLASVQNMLALCGAMVKVAAHGSNKSVVAKTAAACAVACRACEEACKKHADKHAVCKACMESCQKCAKACEAIS